jgi:hypothetical protein
MKSGVLHKIRTCNLGQVEQCKFGGEYTTYGQTSSYLCNEVNMIQRLHMVIFLKLA